MLEFLILLPFLIVGGGFILGSVWYIVSEIKDKKKLESDSAKNYVDISRIFSRTIEYGSLLGEQPVEIKSLKNKIQNLDVFVKELNSEELSRFESLCIDEMPALLKIQKTMLTPKFNVKNETLVELLELVIGNLVIHRKEYEKNENFDLKGELELLKGIKTKRERLIEHQNKP